MAQYFPNKHKALSLKDRAGTKKEKTEQKQERDTLGISQRRICFLS
jgi:hypothetical protein